MAVFDRFRRRDSQGGGLMNRIMGRPEAEAPETEADIGGGTQVDAIDALLRGSSESVQQARAQGMRDGALASMEDAGIEPMRARRGSTGDEDRIMNRKRLNEATRTLLSYKSGKASVERRVIKAQEWWKLKNWEQIEQARGVRGASVKKSNTGWLWNCIVGKHADAIDAYPEPVILPREEGDKEEADKLSKIVPVAMQMNGFEQVYNDSSWQKLQEGTGVYGVFWDPDKLNGLGDIAIQRGNMLNLFWEPGVQDIQDSRNVFYCTLIDKEILVQQHPELEGQLKTNKLALEKYRTDDNIDLDRKAVLIDWYYHTYNGPRKVLHYCQYVDEICLYSSEEEHEGDPEYRGYYEHGKYPFVLDALFPVEGSPAGYGYIDIAKDTQMDIDTLSQAMVKNAVVRATPRYFIKKDGSINEDEFADWSKPFIHSSGMLGQDSVRPVEVMQMGGDAHNMLQQKIDEIKFITGNTDVNNGGVPSGVTAASAIAALKEDSGRSSKDSSKAAYRAYGRIVEMVIELIRQFYDIPRQFRIIGRDGGEEFTTFDNSGIVPQPVSNGGMAEDGMRLPVFDIEVRAQRENAYTKMSQNELAIQFYNMGLFNPQMTDQALMLIEMMDFRGKEELRNKIQANGTIQETLMKVAQIAMALAQRYDPMAAQELGMVLQGVAMDTGMQQMGKMGDVSALGSADNMAPERDPNENAMVRKARERAANASRPN